MAFSLTLTPQPGWHRGFEGRAGQGRPATPILDHCNALSWLSPCCRYLITPQPSSRRGSESTANLLPPPSTKAAHLPIGVSTFCKAFLWHLVLDRNLELVQLGAGFMRIFGKELQTAGEIHSIKPKLNIFPLI